jgi:hypothetical protein
MAACTNLPSKLSRAIGAYLVSAGIAQEQVYPHFCAKERTFANGPIVSPLIYPGQPEPLFTGNRRFKVGIQIKGNESNDGSTGAGETARVLFDAFVGQVGEALMKSDDQSTFQATATLINTAGRALAVAGTPTEEEAKEDWRKAANNADMADFTVTQWVDSTFGGGEAKDCLWEIVIIFEATACESNVD